MVVKVNAPYITDEEVQEVIKVLKSGNLSAGEYVRLFEDSFAKYLGVRHVLTVSNGTVALYLALKAIGVGPGDEVAVPDFTFVATASSVVLAGGKVIPVDIDLETYNIDPEDLEKRLTDKTKAVILVHLYGHPADVDLIKDVLTDKNIFLVEDCAQSHGAEYKGVKTGSLGTVSAFSFYATKNLTMGEGGAVTTNRDDVAEYVKLQRNHGQVEKYFHSVIGWNFRITDIQAALGCVQLAKLDKMNERRRAIAKIYSEELSSLKTLRLPTEKPYAKHVYHQYTVWVYGDGVRDKLSEFLKTRGVQTAVHYPNPIHKQPALKEYLVLNKRLHNSIEASRHVLSLPMHPGLSDEDVMMIIGHIKEFFRDLKT